MPGPLQTIMSVFGILAVIGGAYLTTYLLASRTTKIQQGRMIKVLDRFSVTKDKMICTVEVAGNVYLIAFTNQGATLLDTLDGELYREAKREERGNPLAEGYRTVQSSVTALFPARKQTGWLREINRSVGGTRPARESDAAGKVEALRFAREEDDLDVVYRKIQARKARAENRNVPLKR